MRTKIISFVFFLLCDLIFAQTNSNSVYKNLDTKIFYSVPRNQRTIKGVTKYFVNNKETTKSVYEKFADTWKNMENCCPCILQTLDENDKLMREGVQCTDCGVGWFKEYFPNGNIKISGNYKENPTGNWDSTLWARGYCSVRNGEWIYFSQKGDTLYKEYWNDGKFVKQIPELDSNEVWDVSATLNGKELPKEGAKIKSKDISKIIITPFYKNSRTAGKEVEIKFEISAANTEGNGPAKSFTLSNFNTIDVEKIMKEAGLKVKDKPFFYLSIINRKKLVGDYYVIIKF